MFKVVQKAGIIWENQGAQHYDFIGFVRKRCDSRVHRRTGGLEIFDSFGFKFGVVHRRTGGLESYPRPPTQQ